ncbi:MAG TPA: AEC family transporter [Opitutaceae bacterium]|nr:AEC family transporter [Opitutaceae bacterium]
MTGYATLLGLIAPVFILIAAGVIARRIGWLGTEADASLLKLVVNLFYPCLVFGAVVRSPAIADPANLVWPPLLGFATIVLGFAIGFPAARLAGLTKGKGMRTFAVAVGLFNWGYIPIPLVTGLFPPGTLGVLFVFNVGVEFALWTVGIALMAGGGMREGRKHLFNPVVVSLILAVVINVSGLDGGIPEFAMQTVNALGACAIPLGLVMIGAISAEHIERPGDLLNVRVIAMSTLVRLGLLPVLFLLLARYLPVGVELKQVLVVQAAMPAAVFPMVMAKHYNGHPLTAAQVVAGTTAIALFLIPVWLKAGLAFVGV